VADFFEKFVLLVYLAADVASVVVAHQGVVLVAVLYLAALAELAVVVHCVEEVVPAAEYVVVPHSGDAVVEV